ncbi:MAG: hypothetical protein ABII82_12815 [Verrucomicrobiota bacterium]
MIAPAPAADHVAIPDTLRVLRARELAEQGRLREAEAGLAGADSPSADPRLLHTLAVVVTRQGDYARARRLWRQLAQIRPADPEIEGMIEAIETWQERPSWIGYAPHAATAALSLLLALILWPRAPADHRPDHARPAVVEPLPTVPVTPVVTAPARPAQPVRNTLPAVPAPVVSPTPEPMPMVTFELPPARR